MKIMCINKHFLTLVTPLILIQCITAQVGIGTTLPQGALDLKTTTTGLVYPKVALTSTTVQAPVINPTGPNLEPGTVVYNTGYTQTGTNDVTPGLYVWDGSKWAPQFIREEYVRFEQNKGFGNPYACQRIPFGFNGPVDGLAIGDNSFTPKYSGFYKIKVSTSFGGGEFTDISASTDNNLSTGTSEGDFFFNLSGPGVSITDSDGRVYTHSYSTYNKNNSLVLKYDVVTLDSYIVFIKRLRAGQPYNFNLRMESYNTSSSSGFVNNGTSGNGLHHIGHDIPCSVEFTYLGTNE